MSTTLAIDLLARYAAGERYFRLADLREADLKKIKEDFFMRLSLVPDEVPGLREALVQGEVVGTIANIRRVSYKALGDLRPNPGSPTERWFLAIQPGHTPERSQIVAITVEWIDEWLQANAPAEKK